MYITVPTVILQGETLEVAEVVPFRLTHNMVHALVSCTNIEGCVMVRIVYSGCYWIRRSFSQIM